MLRFCCPMFCWGKVPLELKGVWGGTVREGVVTLILQRKDCVVRRERNDGIFPITTVFHAKGTIWPNESKPTSSCGLKLQVCFVPVLIEGTGG